MEYKWNTSREWPQRRRPSPLARCLPVGGHLEHRGKGRIGQSIRHRH
jgi:hypothetical protein